MATIKQKRVARKLIKALETGEKTTGGELVESSGYGVSMKKNPQVVLKSKGVKDALADLGFTTDGADTVVQHILYKGKREENKLKAADMVYKRFGSYKDTEQGAGKTLVLMVTGESASRYGVVPNTKPSESSS